MKILNIFLIFFAFLFFSHNSCIANDTAYFGKGNTVVPINNNDIQMVSEYITMKYKLGHKGLFTVNAKFVFRNTSVNAVTIQMGFPDSYKRYPGDDTKEWTIKEFTTRIGDKFIPVKHKMVNQSHGNALSGEEGAYVWSVHFKPGETKEIKNRYVTGSMVTPPMFKFTYIVKTGARWRGKIEKAVFEIDLSELPYSPLFTVEPIPTNVKNGIYRISYKNIEPDFNIEVRGFNIHSRGKKKTLNDYLNMRGGYVFRDIIEMDNVSYPSLSANADNIRHTRTKLYNILLEKKVDKETAAMFRNSIFAMHGRPFKNKKWIKYFKSTGWYKIDPKYTINKLSDYEKNVVAIIKTYEDLLK